MSDDAPPDLSINAQVTYSVRELLERIEKNQTVGFTQLTTSLEHKADKGDVQRLENRLDGHQREIETLKGKQHDIEVAAAAINQHKARRWTTRERWLSAASAVAAIGLLFASLAQLHVL